MISAVLRWLAARLPPPRVIFDRNGVSPYLSRYYLIGGPRMADGTSPFDAYGAPREGAVWPNRMLGIYLHHFHRGDDEPELHNHPWRWAVSLVLSGGYIEERRGKDGVVRRRRIRPGTLNIIRSDTFHRVELTARDAWTLFVVGPKFSGWGFWSRDTGRFTPWRQFITELRDPVAFARDHRGAGS